MGSTINATTGVNGGVVVTADNTGIISLQSNGQTFITADSSGNTTIGSAGSLQLKSDSIVSAVMLANGNFGIGNTAPTNTLDVNGNIATQGNVLTPYANRNKLDNGAMHIWQRGTSFTNANGYTADRWYTNRNSGVGNLTVSQVLNPDNRYWMRLQRVAGDTVNNNIAVYQSIEQQFTNDMIGKEVCFSMRMQAGANAVGTTFNMNLYYTANTTDNGPTYGSWSSITGNTQTVSSNGYQLYYQTYNVPNTATQLQVVLTFNVQSGTAGSTDYRDITELQLELGSAPTPFEKLSLADELIRCQRYYELIYNHFYGYVSSGSGYDGYTIFNTVKRTSPSTTYISQTSQGDGYVGTRTILQSNNTIIIAKGTAVGTDAAGGWLDIISCSADL